MNHRLIKYCVAMLLCAICSANASVGDKLKDIAKEPAKPVLDEIEKKAQNLIAQGQQVGNGIISHGGMELDAATRSAILGLGDDVGKTVENLTAGEQAVIISLRELETKVQGLKDTAYDLRDTTVVDLTEWESGWIFAHTPDFFVQSIKGTALLPQAGNYHITVTAYGFGQSSDSKAEITGSVDGKPVKFADVDQTSERGNAIIGLPNDTFSSMFSKDSLKIVTLDLNVTISRKHFFGWKSHSYQFPVKLLLYPAQIAAATVHVTAPKFGWVAVQDVLSAPIITADRDGCKYCDPSCAANNALDVVVPGGHNPQIPGDEHITSAQLECTSGSICAFNCRNSVNVTANGTRAVASWSTSSHPTQWFLRGKVEQWQQTGNTVSDQDIKLNIDTPIVINLPEKYSLITVDVTSFTKQKYTLVLPTNDSHGTVSAVVQPATQNLVLSALLPSMY
ncbi:MAG TPA: hypothetical protein VJW20_07350 [Candidatus Angelobacter sp.]|nr:hypothetical protein [Candidatus Angelobacter sp.]